MNPNAIGTLEELLVLDSELRLLFRRSQKQTEAFDCDKSKIHARDSLSREKARCVI